jgi:putative flippase GtrA
VSIVSAEKPGPASSRRDRLARFAGVSVVSTLATQVCVFTLVDGVHLNGVSANILTVSITSVLSYQLNRAWVWGHRDAHSLRGEVLPYWLMVLAGLVVSTVLAGLAYRHLAAAGWAVSLANLAGFGLVWVLKFHVLERYVFHPERRSRATGPEGPAGEPASVLA